MHKEDERQSLSHETLNNTSFSNNLSQSNAYFSELINSHQQTKTKLLAVGILILLSVISFIAYSHKAQSDISSNIKAIAYISSVNTAINSSGNAGFNTDNSQIDGTPRKTNSFDIEKITASKTINARQQELINKSLDLAHSNQQLSKNINDKYLRIQLENQFIETLNDQLFSTNKQDAINTKQIRQLSRYSSSINRYWTHKSITTLDEVALNISRISQSLVDPDIKKQLSVRLEIQRTNLKDLQETLPSHQADIHKNIEQALSLSKNVKKQVFSENAHLSSNIQTMSYALTVFILCLLYFSVFQFKKNKKEIQQAYDGFSREATVMQHNYAESMQESQAKTNFLSIVSYEARIALDSILGLTKIAKRSSKSDEQINKLDQVISSGTKLNLLLNNISTFIELDDNLIALEEELVPLKNLLSDVNKKFSHVSQKNHVLFESYIDSNIADFYLADKPQLIRIFSYLLNNSCSYTEQGHIIFKAEVDQTQALSTQGQRLNFTIEDTGSPLNKEDQQNFFNAFTKTHNSSSRKSHGEAIKLSIAKHLIQLMGGDISVDNCQGSGVKINFYIQLTVADQIEIDHALKQAESKKLCSSKKVISFQSLNILIVEDNEANACLLTWILEDMKHKVSVAENGIECLNLLENNNFDLIFMDQHMPEMNGIIATEKIRSRSDEKANIPIIGCTADGGVETTEQLLSAGQNEVILKPINEDTIFTVTQNFIKGKYANEIDSSAEEEEAINTGN